MFDVLTAAGRHLKTITYHKYLVAQGCFQIGLYRQGLLHDLSKYSPQEFLVGVRYYQGNRSPNDAEREQRGYSSAWLHHKGRNKHHFEYWIDYSKQARPGEMVPVPMPDRYIAEMFVDRIAACKVYLGKDYTDGAPYAYFLKWKAHACIHTDTRDKLERYLKMLDRYGEKRTFRRIRQELLRGTGNKRQTVHTMQ